MSATINFTTVTNAIEGLTITGVTIKDSDNMTDSVKLSTPTLSPFPAGFVTDIRLSRLEETGQLNLLEYTLNYRYYHCPIEMALGGLHATYGGFITKLAAILLAFASDATLSGALDNQGVQITGIGAIEDPARNVYLGCGISIRISQFLEV